MNIKTILCAAAVCGGITAATAADEVVAEAEKGETEETPIVSATFSLAFDSKYLSYGFVDNRDPILTPAAEVTFFDLLTIGVESIFDTTKYGRKAGYGNRGGKYTELHPYIGLGYSFSPDDYEFLPTTVDLSLTYLYEYHPSAKARHGDQDDGADDDSQFWTLEVGLPDLWLEPVFAAEFDTMRDHGCYLNAEIGHTFNMLGEEDDTLTLRPSIAQGFGTTRRVAAYVGDVGKKYYDPVEDDMVAPPMKHGGLMDTLIKIELTWNICENFALSGYVGYSDFLFDRRIRHAAREYEATGRWDESWNVVCGLGAELTF